MFDGYIYDGLGNKGFVVIFCLLNKKKERKLLSWSC